MAIVQVFNGCLINWLYLHPVLLTLLIEQAFAQNLKSVKLRTVKDIIFLRVAYVISKHHQQLVLLKLLIRNLAQRAQIALKSLSCICVEADKVLIHALWLGVAKDRPFQRLPSHMVLKFYRDIVFEAKQRMVIEDLKSEDELVIVEIRYIIEILVCLNQIVTNLNGVSHGQLIIQALIQLFFNKTIVDSQSGRSFLNRALLCQLKFIAIVAETCFDVVLMVSLVYIEDQKFLIFLISYQVFIQYCHYKSPYFVLKQLDPCNFFTKFFLMHAFVEDLIQLLNIHDFFFSVNDELTLLLVVFHFLLDVEQEDLAHKWSRLISNGPKDGQKLLLILEALPR